MRIPSSSRRASRGGGAKLLRALADSIER